jgi:hypothetical protein
VTASLSASGLVPISAAIAGSEVAMTVESMFSMNRATATIRGTMRFANMGDGTVRRNSTSVPIPKFANPRGML